MLYSQADGVVSFTLPVRNSLKFNKFLINPTFSFVREQSTIVSFYNKRQWIQFDDAPQTYLLSYSGRFRENEGIAVGLFQQNYGVLTTFGAVANFAHNVILQEDSNLTFGIDVGFYKSGLNKSKVITNYPDPSLENIPSNSLITVNPGINYGTAFLDFGLSANNLFLYNLKTSKIVEDDPEKSIEMHIMHTGYLDTYGFFDKSKFSALLKTELKKDKTVISGLLMFAIPKGVWAQAGYNTVYGISGGLGLNITPKISIEYNFEQATGNLSNFGSSHEIVLAYKFKSNSYYYGDDEEEGSIISPAEPKKVVPAHESTILSPIDAQRLKELKLAMIAEKEEIRLFKLKGIAEAKAKLAADTKAKLDFVAAAKAKLVADAAIKAKLDADADATAKAKLSADAQVKAKPVIGTKTKLDVAAKAKADALAQSKLTADAKAKADALFQSKLTADAKIKADALAQAKLAADAKAKGDALTQAKLAANAKAKADAVAGKLAVDAKAKADAYAAKLAADAKAKSDADAAKLSADAKAKADAVAAKLAADAKAKADADAAKITADAKAKADAEPGKLAADAKAKADAVAAKLAADTKAKADAEAAKLSADAKAKSDVDAAKLAADAKAKADAEAAKLAADVKAKADVDAAKLAAVSKPKDDNAKSMDNIALSIEASGEVQQQLLIQLNDKVAQKQKELQDLKKENDLSDQGIASAPKQFKSVSAENAALEALKSEIDLANRNQYQKLSSINVLYEQRIKQTSDKNDALTLSYLKTINELKSEQKLAEQSNNKLIAALVQINEATEIEKKRRIKRANFVNEDNRYITDQETLRRLKVTTPISSIKLKAEDFDYGNDQSNMQIIKNIKNVETGYYLVLAVHEEVSKRDTFVTKAISAGEKNINFFYDVKSTNYFIYIGKYDDLTQASQILESRGSKPYNGKMTIVRVEN